MARKFICTKTEPIVQTKAGKLRGFILDGTYIFHGIKYANAKRFRQPTPVEPWEGVKDALAYGYVCPLLKQDEPNNEVMIPHRYWPMDENCQYLNIWTQSVDSGAKKPVMVWLHGGGFAAGSSIEQVAYDGENLSRYGDVVVVTLNHRLNILGYLDLSPFGAEYANSANAGNADIVAALQWIQDNIASFGGDPGNVTIFGQSGGGRKVWSLMQTPAADGLFHKGIVQSTMFTSYFNDPDTDGTAIVNAMMAELGITDVKELETVPYPLMADAYNKVSPGVRASGHYIGNKPMPNDWYVGDPLVVGFTEHATKVPVMIGTTLGEFSFMPALDPAIKDDPAAIDACIQKHYGDHAEQMKAMFAEAFPDKHISELLYLDSIHRVPMIEFVKLYAKKQESPIFTYQFTYTLPYDGGHVAWHCAEIPYAFHNTDLVPVCQEEGVTERLEQQICDAWVNFARYGAPSSDALPQWPRCTEDTEYCMIFDKVSEIRCNHDHEIVKRHLEINPGTFRLGNEENKVQH